VAKSKPKQRNSYQPNKIFMGDGGELTEEEREALAASKERKEKERKELVEKRLRGELNEADYNASLFKISEDLDYIRMFNNHVIIRLLLKPKTKGGIILTKSNAILDPSDPTKVKYETDESHAAKALHRGVVVKLGETCSDLFKASVSVGDIVDLQMTVNPNNYMTLIDKENMDFDNYYSLPETYIHYVWTKDLKNYKKGSTPSASEETKESPSSLIVEG
jgi:hypothetical protein